MEQYIKIMQNADREAGIITDRANRYARDLAEIDENTIYTPDYKEAAAAIGKVATFTNIPDIFRELLKAQRSFNRFYGDAGADCNAAWNLPIDAIRERDLRAVMGLL